MFLLIACHSGRAAIFYFHKHVSRLETSISNILLVCLTRLHIMRLAALCIYTCTISHGWSIKSQEARQKCSCQYLARKDGFVLPTIHTCGDSQSGRSTRLTIVWSKFLILQANTFILASFLGLPRLQHLITCSWSKTEAREGLKSRKWKQG